jgi:hypothetical protein
MKYRPAPRLSSYRLFVLGACFLVFLLALIAPLGAQTQTTSGEYTVLTWTNTGSFTWTVPTGAINVEYLVVGGGGGGAVPALSGGNAAGGGGGGGQVRTGSMSVTPGQQLQVQVGSGGLGERRNQAGTRLRSASGGNQSSFGSVIASGGGVGTYSGGISGNNNSGGSHTSGSGGENTQWSSGGGGGGAGGSGGNATTTSGGQGGPGTYVSMTGQTYGGGGGGAWITLSINPEPDQSSRGNFYTGGWGGSGGGGHGGTTKADWAGVPEPIDVSSGQANTGGGGGGNAARAPGNGDSFTASGGDGGSGIVVVRYIYSAPPSVTTGSSSNIGPNSATISASLTNIGGTNVTQHGIVWSTSQNPTINLSTRTERGSRSSTTNWSDTITGLSENTTYYVRAYATNSGGTVYGSQITFTTRTHIWAIDQDLANVSLGFNGGDNASSVTQSLQLLPNSGSPYGSSLSWTTSNANLIQVDGRNTDVFRPWDADGSVTLTVTGSRGGFTRTRSFPLTVKAEPLTFSAESIQNVVPGKVHVDDPKRITVSGSGFRGYINKSLIDFRVIKGGFNQQIPANQILIVNDNTMVLTVPVDTSNPVGSYTLQFNHSTLPNITRANAFEVTNDARFRAPKISSLELQGGASAGVSSLQIQGEFEQLAPGRFQAQGQNQIITINGVLKLAVAGSDLQVDTRAGRESMSGSGRFYVDTVDRSGARGTVTISDGPFSLAGFDLRFNLQGTTLRRDYLGLNMGIGPSSFTFNSPDSLRLSGTIDAGFDLAGSRIGSTFDLASLGVNNVFLSRSGFDLDGQFEISSEAKVGPFNAPSLVFGLDTRIPRYDISAGAEIPKLGAGFTLDFTLRRGALERIQLTMEKKMQFPQFGIQMDWISGELSNLANAGGNPVTFTATSAIRDMVAPEIAGRNLLNLNNLQVTLSPAHLDASGTANIYGLIDVGSASFVTVWEPGLHPQFSRAGFELVGNVNIVDVVVGQLQAAYWQGESFRGSVDAQVQIPSSVPLVGGQSVAKAAVATDSREARAEASVIGIGFIMRYLYQNGAWSFDVAGALRMIGDVAVAVGKAVVNLAKAALNPKKTIQGAANDAVQTAVEVARDIANAVKNDPGVQRAKALQKSQNTQLGRSVANLNVGAAKANAAVKATPKAVGKGVKRKAKKAVRRFFCEEGREAIALYLEEPGYYLFEVNGMLSHDLVIQSPDYYFTEDKADATRFYQVGSGYNANPAPERTLTPYDENTGAGNFLYIADQGTAFAVLYVDQPGLWTFIDWAWKDGLTQAERDQIENFVRVEGTPLNPGTTMDFVVTNMLEEITPISLEFSVAERVVFEIPTLTDEFEIVLPTGGLLPLEFNSGSPNWNAIYLEEADMAYVVAEVVPGEWLVERTGFTTLDVRSIAEPDLTTAELLQGVLDSPFEYFFTINSGDIAEGRILLAIGRPAEGIELFRADGTQVPLQTEPGPERNAFIDELTGVLYVSVAVGLGDVGSWSVVNQREPTFVVIPIAMGSSIEDLEQLVAESDPLVNTSFEITGEFAWLIRVTGAAAADIDLLNPAFEPVLLPMEERTEFGEQVVFIRLDSSPTDAGRWTVQTSGSVAVQVFSVFNPALSLADLADAYREGPPHVFVYPSADLGRHLFEIQLSLPPDVASGFAIGDIADSIEVIDPNANSIPLVFHPATGANAFYNADTQVLSIFADSTGIGFWHINADYATTLAGSVLMGDPAESLDTMIAMSENTQVEDFRFELEGSGTYLLEIEGGNANTQVFAPHPEFDMQFNEVTLTAANSRLEGDILYVMIETVDTAPIQSWRVVSIGTFAVTASFIDPNDPTAPITLGDLLDSDVIYSLDLGENTLWAIEIAQMTPAALAALVLRNPDGDVYALDAENHLYNADTGGVVIRVTVGAGEGGTWKLQLPSQRPVSLLELEPLPAIDEFSVNEVTGEGDNVLDLSWRVINPRAGSSVSFVLLSEAAVIAENFSGPTLLGNQLIAGSKRVHLPDGLAPGTYRLLMSVSNPSGVLHEVSQTSFTVVYADTPNTVANVRTVRVGDGEIEVAFDDSSWAQNARYLVATHRLSGDETAATVPVSGFRGAILDVEASAGTGGGMGQTATLAGLATDETYLIAIYTLRDGAGEIPLFSVPSAPLEVFLPEPVRPEVAFTVAVPATFTANTLEYDVPLVFIDYDFDENGVPREDANGDYLFVENTVLVPERSTLLNSPNATINVGIGNTPSMPSTIELYRNGLLAETSASGVVNASFEISGLTEGEHVIEIVATNANGDRATYSERLLVDLTPPYLVIFGPNNGQLFFEDSVTVSGEIDPLADLVIELNGVPQTITESEINAQGVFEKTFSGLAYDSLHTLNIRATSQAGNVSERTLEVLVVTPPTDLPADNADLVDVGLQNATLSGTFSSKTFTYTATTSGNVVDFAPATLSPTAIVQADVNGTGFTAVNPQEGLQAFLNPGSNTVVLRVTSADGNTTQDYEFIINSPMQSTPTITTLPTASSIAHGSPLSQSTLTGGSASVPGEFFWTNPGSVPPAGSSSQSVTFFPDDDVNFSTTTVSVDVVALLASQVVITTPPVGGPSGTVLAAQPIVEIRDAEGRLVITENTRTVSVSIASGTGGSLGGTQTITVSGGVGTFSDLTLSGLVGQDYILTFSSTGLTPATSQVVNVTPGAPSVATSTITVNTPSAMVDETDGVELWVQLRDAQGNLIQTDAATVAVTSSFDFGSAIGLGTTAYLSEGQYRATAASAKTGTATFGATINGTPLQDAVNVTFTPGEPAEAIIDREPVETVAGVPIHPSPRLILRDRFGNPVGEGIAVEVAIASGSGEIVSGLESTTVTTDSTGRATFSGIIIEKAEEGYRLEFTVREAR